MGLQYDYKVTEVLFPVLLGEIVQVSCKRKIWIRSCKYRSLLVFQSNTSILCYHRHSFNPKRKSPCKSSHLGFDKEHILRPELSVSLFRNPYQRGNHETNSRRPKSPCPDQKTFIYRSLTFTLMNKWIVLFRQSHLRPRYRWSSYAASFAVFYYTVVMVTGPGPLTTVWCDCMSCSLYFEGHSFWF